MLGKLNHIALVVPNLSKAAQQYKNLLQANVSEKQILPEHGVEIIFITLPNTKIELLTPIDETSPIYKFLQENPNGAMHHVCYEVENIEQAKQHLQSQGARILGDGEVKIGAHNKPVLFLSPKDFCGTLIELEQA